jgi:Raf kinase inhibitor-like YbhB/YbcL family protein
MRPIHRASEWVVTLVFAVGLSGACSSSSTTHDAAPSDSGSSTDSAVDGAATMTLTSSALTEGGMFPVANTCAGVNTSPPLAWSGAPAGTASYAVMLSDLNNAAAHWVIWDIPAATTSLPADLPGDTTLTTPVSAMQLHKVAFFMAGGAYRGPCPGGSVHTYQFEVNALPTATLAGVTAASTTEDIRTLIRAASHAHGDLSGTSNAAAPPADAGGQ